uniref:Chitin-binding type-2 domain-containing protein n=1 Tax=Anopheles christyi TaxID=43041 RepID=A0A182K5E6_9DIPT
MFNPATKRCVTADLYSCDETSPEITTQEPSPYCRSNPNGIVPHPADCDKYIVCEGSLGTVHFCPHNEQFSWKKLGCGADFSCSDYFNGYERTLESVACGRQSLGLAEHPYEVGSYIDCNAQESHSCDDGTVFRWNYQRCLPGEVATNELKSAAPHCGAFGESPHPYLCEKYFKCIFWISSLKTCPLGMIYSTAESECVAGNFQTCSINP